MGALGAFAAAALFGMALASVLTVDQPRFGRPLQNPFDGAASEPR